VARPSSKHPTELELEILKVLWRLSPRTVSQVREALVPFRDLAITSVVTIMNIMVRKKYLAREKRTGSYEYRPLVSEQATAGRMLKDIVDRVFDGSAAVAVAHLLETGDLNERELKRVRALLKRQGGSKP
jgi:BlaI family transcriptional regulator, penicillinase repressor